MKWKDKSIGFNNGGNDDIILVSHVTLIWTVQNVIDPKDQMTFKVLPVEPQLRGGEL